MRSQRTTSFVRQALQLHISEKHQYFNTVVLKYCYFLKSFAEDQKQIKILTVSTGYLFSPSYFFRKVSYSPQLPGAIFIPCGAELFSCGYPSWSISSVGQRPFFLQVWGTTTVTHRQKRKLSVPAEEVQLLIMGVEVLLELLRAHETTVALVTWPVLLLLSENYIQLEMPIKAFQSLPIKCLIFLPQAFLSSVGCISPLVVRQPAEFPALLHLALLLSPLHCGMTTAHHRKTKRSLRTIHMDNIDCLKFREILK